MSFQEAVCRVYVEQSTSPLLLLPNCSDVPIEIRLQWLRFISEQFLDQQNSDGRVRDWDFILRLDGSGENRADNTSPASLSTRVYSACYRIPNAIIERLDSSEEKVRRAELFALGGLLYQVLSGEEMFSNLEGEEHIQSCLAKGEFPKDVWELPNAVRVLACWCPRFARDLLAARGMDESLRSKVRGYIIKHPVLFGLQVAGGIASLASITALPILGAVGFGAVGPAAGSAAAAWQSSIGLVEAGSFFAWCQSAAMGGAAVGGILATGLAGAGVAVGAALMGALDGVNGPATDLKEKFLIAWSWDISGTYGKTELEVKESTGACYKQFGTRSQAEGFIEDWKESFADAWRRAVRGGLDQGLRPRDMKLSVEGILYGTDEQTEDVDALDEVKLNRLSLKEE